MHMKVPGVQDHFARKHQKSTKTSLRHHRQQDNHSKYSSIPAHPQKEQQESKPSVQMPIQREQPRPILCFHPDSLSIQIKPTSHQPGHQMPNLQPTFDC
ncbi:hypothetical protein Nepgr_031577 [Nepenthes gracilis]|uniref:Uncharacterized protein n=1 Tax=Nepenthes gracilis TaxID=150966 RepID=A0AAD3TIJ7_NEPGR|nr:hypothetical protein Nepgr_031577 [Nepenthes gracilis]